MKNQIKLLFLLLTSALLFGTNLYAQPGQRMTAEEMTTRTLDTLQSKMTLSDTQLTTIKEALTEFNSSMEANRPSSTNTKPDMSKMKALEETRNAKVKTVLDDNQYATYLEVVNKRGDRGNKGEKGKKNKKSN